MQDTIGVTFLKLQKLPYHSPGAVSTVLTAVRLQVAGN